MRTRGTVRTPDGTGVAYQVEGDGHPLLVLTGQANNHHWWDVVWPDLAAYRTVSIDWRGTGFSADGPADFTTRSLAADVVDVVDPPRPTDRGRLWHVDGCRVAQWLAVDHPDRVRRLVLGCTTPGGPHAVERSMEVVRRRLARRRPRGGVRGSGRPHVHAGMAGRPSRTVRDPRDPGISAFGARRHLRASARETHTRNFRRSRHPPSS